MLKYLFFSFPGNPLLKRVKVGLHGAFERTGALAYLL